MLLARGDVIPRNAEAWPGALVDRSGVRVKEITPSVAALATHFPAHPADRLIAATARADDIHLASRDARLLASRSLRDPVTSARGCWPTA